MVLWPRLILWQVTACHVADPVLCCRNFADVLGCVSGPEARVAAVTSLERANAVNDKERPGFFDKIHQVL